MKKNKLMIFLFIMPTILCLLLMFVYPVARTVIMSFFRVESLTASTDTWSFYGLQNFVKIFNSTGFRQALKNMVNIWFVGGVITLTLSMLMAVVLTSGIRGAKFFKAAIYMPNIISAVALATMWIQYIFHFDYGLLNELVQLLGGEKVKWLGSDLKFWAMLGAFILGSVGYYMLIYISGIDGIPKDLYEAATLDGATKVDQFTKLTLPLYSLAVQWNLKGRVLLIALYIMLQVPYTTIYMLDFFATLSKSYEEAAYLDGCSPINTFWKIMLPLVQPAVITVTIFNFLSVWNEFFMALIFTTSESMTPVGVGLLQIVNAMKYSGNYGGMFAAVIIVFLPTFLLYIFMSEKIIAGVTGGGVKG